MTLETAILLVADLRPGCESAVEDELDFQTRDFLDPPLRSRYAVLMQGFFLGCGSGEGATCPCWRASRGGAEVQTAAA